MAQHKVTFKNIELFIVDILNSLLLLRTVEQGSNPQLSYRTKFRRTKFSAPARNFVRRKEFEGFLFYISQKF